MDDLNERLEPSPDSEPLRQIEIVFGLPVYVTRAQHSALVRLVEEIVNAPCNQPKNGVHWLASMGNRPNFSAIDAALLGVRAGPAEVADGDEPVFDDDVFQMSTHARSFTSERERTDVERRRAKVDDCPVCQEPRYMCPAGPVCKNGHGG